MNTPFADITAASLGRAGLAYVIFVAVLFLGSRFLPGRTVQGRELGDGTRRQYKLNGLLLFLAVMVTGLSILSSARIRLSFLYTHFWELFVVANVFSVVLSALLFAAGGQRRSNPIAEFWYGTSLNPTLCGVDLKVYFYRPSLFAWALFNLSCAAVQQEVYGGISDWMWMYLGFTTLYLAGTFQYERGLLSMYDVIEERFGFMLVWGDYVLVPFFYCLPAFFLIDRTQPVPVPAAAALCLLFAFGFWLFRGANGQKNQFRSDPTKPIWGKTPETIGGRLLISGFWGIGRKLNYAGEILVYLSWTMTCGVNSFWPYLLPLWLTGLLVHRAHRDDRRCRAKYGQLWDKYCHRVRFRMLPFIW